MIWWSMEACGPSGVNILCVSVCDLSLDKLERVLCLSL